MQKARRWRLSLGTIDSLFVASVVMLRAFKEFFVTPGPLAADTAEFLISTAFFLIVFLAIRAMMRRNGSTELMARVVSMSIVMLSIVSNVIRAASNQPTLIG